MWAYNSSLKQRVQVLNFFIICVSYITITHAMCELCNMNIKIIKQLDLIVLYRINKSFHYNK